MGSSNDELCLLLGRTLKIEVILCRLSCGNVELRKKLRNLK